MKRAVPYFAGSTQDQTTANQERELREVAERAGWQIVDVTRITELATLRAETSDRLSTGCIKRPHNANSMWSWPGRLIDYAAACKT